MLMVIFGAGASYDSCSSFPVKEWNRDGTVWFRPPLANELFLPVAQFRQVSHRYRRFQPLLPYLEGRVDVEGVLEGLRAKAESDEECRRQLQAVQYYLKDLIQRCQSHWEAFTLHASNYKTLLDQLRGSPRVSLVTFNYDTMLETALAAIDHPLQKNEDYLRGKYPLIKPHGSVDWSQWVSKTGMNLFWNEQPPPDEIIHAALVVDEHVIIGKETPTAPPTDRYFELPALAIPTVTKSTFVCPEEHLTALNNLLPTVTKILVIGWRAAEQHFLDILAKGIKRGVKILAVCGSRNGGEETLQRMLRARVLGDAGLYEGGFSDFVVERCAEQFLLDQLIDSPRYKPFLAHS